MEEKLGPWFQAIMDNMETLLQFKNGDNWRRELEHFQKKGLIEMEAITYIRGRSIPNAIILIDECQNLSKDDVKTILTRAGENTKIILTGDIEQIDNSALDATSNGLTYVIEKFKESDLAGHITFTQGERSKLASKAAEIL
jgi:PhoH-like ATPase